jgi:hypothetical protein
VHQVRQRVLRERLEEMAVTGEQRQDEDLVRLALCCLALLKQHKVDDRGRCRQCRRRGWRPGARQCAVLVTTAFYLEQPRAMVATATQR